jgi:hypothetical protein
MSDEIGRDDVHIRLTCPHCRRQFQKTAAWIDANDYVRCDFCREPFGLRIYKMRKPAAPAAVATATKAPTPVPAAKAAKSKKQAAAAPAKKARATPSKRKRKR